MKDVMDVIGSQKSSQAAMIFQQVNCLIAPYNGQKALVFGIGTIL